jgi:hypothetical protein
MSESLVPDRLEAWRRSLIDLTYRNRLIKYRPTTASTIEIAAPTLDILLTDPGRSEPWHFYFPPEPEPEEAPAEDAAAEIDDRVVRSVVAHRTPHPDEIVVADDAGARRINRTLENLARKSNAEFQDKAIRVLYIAAGFLDWVDPTREEALSSPLLLVPVELRRPAAGRPYSLYFVEDEEITVNPSLTEKLRRDLGRAMPEDWAWEEKPISVELDEIEASVRKTGWTVRRDAAISLFSFQKFVMYRDLLANEDVIVRHPLVRSLAGKQLVEELEEQIEIPDLHDLDEIQSPETDYSIRLADATQRRCIEAARRGQSFVMHGPPGTGKSQTIANMIADAIGHGKRVLFVSEKAAALDVVHNRLAAQGLDEFCLLLHGEHAARREVVESLHRSMSGRLVAQVSMTSQQLERLGQLRVLLNSTAEMLHLPMPQLGDRALRDVLGQLAELHAAPTVPAAPDPSAAQGGELRTEYQQLQELFERLGERWQVSPRAFVWRDYRNNSFNTDDRARVLAAVDGARESTLELLDTAAAAAKEISWPAPTTSPGVETLIALIRHLAEAPNLAPHWLAGAAADELKTAAADAEALFETERASLASLLELYPQRGLERLPETLATDYEESVEALDQLVGRTTGWGTDLLSALPQIKQFLHRAPALIEELKAASSEASELLGQPSPGALEDIDSLAELATLGFSAGQRPEAEWLVKAGLERVEAAVTRVGSTIREFQAEREELRANYDDAALALDAEALHQRFSTDYQARLAKLKSDYRRDKQAVKAVRRDTKLPATVVDDLAKIRKAQELKKTIDFEAEQLELAFGSYFAGPDTDVERLSQAVETTRAINRLAAPTSKLTALAAQVSTASTPNPHLAQLAERLRAADSALRVGIDALRPFVRSTAPLHPGLHDLADRLEQIRIAVDTLDRAAAQLDAGAGTPAATLKVLDVRAAAIRRAHDTKRRIAENQPHWAERLAPYYRGGETDWPEAGNAIGWLAELGRLTDDVLPDGLKAKVLAAGTELPDVERLARNAEEYAAALLRVAGLFEEAREQEIAAIPEDSGLTELARHYAALADHIDDLHEWVEYRAARDRIVARGWGEFASSLAEAEVDAGDVAAAFQRAFWSRRLEALFADEPELADRGSTYLRWIEEFRELDAKLVTSGADRLIAASNRKRRTHVALPGSQVALLRNEAAKRKRHMPVRTLLARLPNLLSELKPCLMMSPLTVSSFLAPTHTFDLVIFDEASQVPPQDAINCIYRGSQLIVAGDNRQLPPTPFFQLAEADEAWDETTDDVAEDMESILDSCEALLPLHPLQWHYRSRHEALIAFSNKHVYKDELVTFPSADISSATKGVKWVFVDDGVYERGPGKGINRPEARVAAERVIEHLSTSTKTVGVITFNAAQQTAVTEELERLRIDHPELEARFSRDRLDNVFVKNLESVQGDERDVIIFSLGYGRDADGKFTMNFGPLNKDGGYRRLNVAITRARELVEVVTSVRGGDFKLGDNAGRGPRMLADYVTYAENGGWTDNEPAQRQVQERDELARFERVIVDAVEELGYHAERSVGAGTFGIDVAVRDPERPDSFLLGILTDGSSYRAIPTTRDRERLRETVLRDLRWKIHRVWSLDWARNRQSEFDRLREALERAAVTDQEEEADAADQAASTERERTEEEIPSLLDALDAGELEWVVPYRRCSLENPHNGYDFHHTVNRDLQKAMVIELVRHEGPIHADYVVRRLVQAWGAGRTSERMGKAATQAIKMAVRTGLLESRGKFLWPSDYELPAVREPDWSDAKTCRGIDEIPPEEIDLALTNLIALAGGDRYEGLVPDVARVLGFDRVGPKIRPAIEKRLAKLDR